MRRTIEENGLMAGTVQSIITGRSRERPQRPETVVLKCPYPVVHYSVTVYPLSYGRCHVIRGSIVLEVKILFPLFRVYASDNLNLEIQFMYEMEVPRKIPGLAKEEEEHWEEAVGTMANDLEGLVSMLGVDGGGCVRKALCELSAVPSISPEGLTGEMLQLFVRHLRNQDMKKVFEEEEEESAYDNVDDESGGEEDGEEKSPGEGQTEAVSEWDMYRNGNETRESGNERVESETEKPKERRKENRRNKNPKGTNKRRQGRSVDGEETEGDEEAEKRQRQRRRKWKRTKRDYTAATLHGKTHGNCRDAFPECPVSLLQLLSAGQRPSPATPAPDSSPTDPPGM
nr:uncharacterized protein LOC123757076 [Procambarus clarkii]